MGVNTLCTSWGEEMVSTGGFHIMKLINLEEVCNPFRVYTIQTRCSNDADFRWIMTLAGAMSMIDTGMESLPMVAIFILLSYSVCEGFEISFALRKLNNFRVG